MSYSLLSDEDQKKLDEMRAGIDALAPQPQEQPDYDTDASPVEAAPQPEAQPTQQISQISGTQRPNETLDRVLKMLSDRVMNDKPSPEETATNDKWALLERQKLDRLTNPAAETAQDWAQGLGTALPMIGGMLLSAGSQRSRGPYGTPMESGFGKVAEAGVAGAQALAQQRQQREQTNAALAQQAQMVRKGNQDKDYDKLQKLASTLSERDRINIAMQNMGLRGADTELKAAAQDFRLNPTNEQAVNFKAFLKSKGMDPAQVDAMGMAALQQAAHQINTQTDDVHFPTELTQAGAKAGRTAGAAENTRSFAEAANAARDAETKRQIALGGGIGGAQATIATAPEVNKATGKTQQDFQSATDKFYNDMQPTLNSMGAIQEIMKQKPAKGDIPGLGRKDRLITSAGGGFFLSDKAQAVTQMADRVIEMYSRDQSGAAIAQSEAAKFLKQVLGDPNASGRDVEQALDRFYTSQGNAVRGRAAGNPDAAQSVLDNMGLNFNVLNSKVRAKRAPKQSSASGSLHELVTSPGSGSSSKPNRPTLGDFE